MSDTDAYSKPDQDKILAALREVNGTSAESQKALILAAGKDHALLLALARPFMKGIVAHAVERLRPLISGGATATPAKIAPARTANVREIGGKAPSSASRTSGGKGGFVGKLIREDQLSDSNKAAHAANLKALAAAFKKKT